MEDLCRPTRALEKEWNEEIRNIMESQEMTMNIIDDHSLIWLRHN